MTRALVRTRWCFTQCLPLPSLRNTRRTESSRVECIYFATICNVFSKKNKNKKTPFNTCGNCQTLSLFAPLSHISLGSKSYLNELQEHPAMLTSVSGRLSDELWSRLSFRTHSGARALQETNPRDLNFLFYVRYFCVLCAYLAHPGYISLTINVLSTSCVGYVGSHYLCDT